MAITKPVTLDTGVVAEHWELTHAAQDFAAGIIDLTLHGWLDGIARVAAREPLAVRRVRVTVGDLADAGVALDLTEMLEPLLQKMLA